MPAALMAMSVKSQKECLWVNYDPSRKLIV